MDTVISLLTGLSDSQVRAFRHTSTLAGELGFCCMHTCMLCRYMYSVTCIVFASYEVDDSLGKCRSEPEHQHGQHTEAV